MERLIVMIIAVSVVTEARHHHLKFAMDFEDVPHVKKSMCTSEHEELRNSLIEESKCGKPKDVFVELKPSASFEQITPSSIWVKRCVGHCDFQGDAGSKCEPAERAIRHIPVRITSAKTGKQHCATYKVEEHVSCRCSCTMSPEECGAIRELNHRKCACTCPNKAERKQCLLKKNNSMRWNRYKCKCEKRHRRRRLNLKNN